MASADDIAELQRKLDALIVRRFGAGGWAAAFAAYDKDQDDLIGRRELLALLTDADVGNLFTRDAWVDGVLGELDSSNDGNISYGELSAVLQARGSKATKPPATPTARPDYLFPVDYPANFTPVAPNPKPRAKPKPKPTTSGGDFWLILGAVLGGGYLLLRKKRRA